MTNYKKNKRSDDTFYPKKTTVKTVYNTPTRETTDTPLPKKSMLTCNYVTLWNMDLNGTEVIDGGVPSNGDKILVANQSDQKQNDIYTYNDSDDWTRDKVVTPGATITITGGAKQGTMWIVETPSFKIGTDNISIVESALNRKGGDYNNFNTLSAADEDLLLAEDYSDSYNKKRVSLSALKTFFNFLSKAANNFTTFTSVTPDGDDVLLVEDESDSYNKKKITITSLLDLVPEGIMAAEYTLYVSPTFPNEGKLFSTLTAAITYANTPPNDAQTWTIILYSGTYTGNYNLMHNIIRVQGNVLIKPLNKDLPTFNIESGQILGYPVIDDLGANGNSYIIVVKKGAKLQLKRCHGGYGAMDIQTASGSPTVYITIDGDDIDKIKDSNAGGNVYMEANIKVSNGLEMNGNLNSEYKVNCHQVNGVVKITKGTMHINSYRYVKISGVLLEVNDADGVLIASGRIEKYADGSNAPIVQSAGKMVLYNIFAKNSLGAIVDATGGHLYLANNVFEAGAAPGGYHPCINGSPSYTITYNNHTSMNSEPMPIPGITENVDVNKLVNSAVKI